MHCILFSDDDEVRFVLDQHAELDLYSASLLKQKSAGRHVTPLRHIILILIQPLFAISPYCCVLSGEATYTNCIRCFAWFLHNRPRLSLLKFVFSDTAK
jgi:hypothetical protein